MCSVILHFDPRHKWPIRMAANRDEMMDRPWLPPGYHWPAWHHILAGKDIKGGGSWMGMNHAGVVAVILNRFGTLGSKPGKSSRGGLILSALQHDNAAQAVSRVDASLRNARYRPCNLIVADATSAYVISLRARAGDEDATSISIDPISPGVHMLTSRDLDDTTDPRVNNYLSRFQACHAPDPEGDWSSWSRLMADTIPFPGAGPESALCFELANRFATVSSSLLAIPGQKAQRPDPIWLFASGKPGVAPYRHITMFP